MQLTALLALALVSVVAAAPAPLATRAQDIVTIHPNGDKTKCVGVLGGAFVVGAAVDIYDCNGSATQKWRASSGPRMINPADGSAWALDIAHTAGDPNVLVANGVKAVLNKSADGGEDGSPYQSWNGRGSPQEPAIRLNVGTDNKDFCLDLTNGSKTNKNPLQIWECFKGNTNQIWTYTVVGQV
ncbi:ricin B lectin domain-containing protein [Mycena crocata]|nr:ricin B lectin domain-containing protein [Mycena crocata]